MHHRHGTKGNQRHNPPLQKKRHSEKKHFQGLEYSKGEDSQCCIMLLQEILGSKDSRDESCRNTPTACLQGSTRVIFLNHTDSRDEVKSLLGGKFFRVLAHKEKCGISGLVAEN